MNEDTHRQIREALSRPDAFPDKGPVEIRETHISVVFLTPRHAWKLLKPVKFDFLDFSTVQQRHDECRNEVRLNSRLAADVYLGVVPVTRTAEGLAVGGDGEAVDWLIQMRRLPDAATLDAKIAAGGATVADLERVLDVLQPFFERAEKGPRIDASGEPAVIRRNLVENIDVLLRQPDLQNDAAVLRSMQLQFVATQTELFARRVAERWVRDVHGDLRAEHIYLTEPPAIVDCIAFNDRLRHVDLLDEICFLATDLQRLGRDDLAAAVVRRYRQRMNDRAPEPLADFHRSYRFAVRAKVACLSGAQGAEKGSGLFSRFVGGFLRALLREKSPDPCSATLLHNAIAAMEPAHRPHLIAFCGVSGSGKSTIARALAEQIGAVHLRSDEVRKELHGIATEDHASRPELYARTATERTYAELLKRAGDWLTRGATVLLDATFQQRADRDAAREIARRRNLPFLLAYCAVSAETARERIEKRQAKGRDASDADAAVLQQQLHAFDAPAEIPAESLLTIDAERPVEESLRQIVSRLPVV